MIIKLLIFIFILCFAYESYINIKQSSSRQRPASSPQIIEGFNVNIGSISVPSSDITSSLLYNPDDKLYWSRRYLFEEGLRQDTEFQKRLDNIKYLESIETDPDKKREYAEILKLWLWRDNLKKNWLDGRHSNRMSEEVLTEYDKANYNCIRPWLECHSHLPYHNYYQDGKTL